MNLYYLRDFGYGQQNAYWYFLGRVFTLILIISTLQKLCCISGHWYTFRLFPVEIPYPYSHFFFRPYPYPYPYPNLQMIPSPYCFRTKYFKFRPYSVLIPSVLWVRKTESVRNPSPYSGVWSSDNLILENAEGASFPKGGSKMSTAIKSVISNSISKFEILEN